MTKKAEKATGESLEALQGLADDLQENLRSAQGLIRQIVRLPVGWEVEQLEPLVKLHRMISQAQGIFERSNIQLPLPVVGDATE